MKILILTDSRGMWPREYNWPAVFHHLIGKQHEVYTYVGGVDAWLISLQMMEQHLLKNFPDTHFDLIILQAGWHEGGPCAWPKEIWEKNINTETRKFDESKMVQPVTHENKTKYLYVDRETERSIIDKIKSKCRNFIFVGMHSLPPGSEFEKGYNLPFGHCHYQVLESNFEFSKNSTSFNFPQYPRWAKDFCLPNDEVHYNTTGINYLSLYLARYFFRMDLTIPSILKSSTKHKNLYEESLITGSYISKKTKHKDVILISGKDNDKIIKIFLGSILYGRIPIIIQSPSPKVSEKDFAQKMIEIKNQENPSLCFCDIENRKDFEKFFDTVTEIEKSEILQYPTVFSKDIAFKQLSSGSTGSVKILDVTHEQVIENCVEYANFIDLKREDSIASWLPLYHDMGLITSFLIPVLVGCDFHTINTFDWLYNPVLFLKLINDKKATHVWMPNFAFSYLQRIKDEEITDISLSSLKHVFSCSEPTYSKYISSFQEKFSKCGLSANISNCYALAENVFCVSQSLSIENIEIDGQQFADCGKPLPGISVLIFDENDNTLPEGAVGKVFIKSNTVCSRKLNKYGYYDTGDLGVIKDGHIYITGRSKDSFVSFGKNIYPHAIELSISNTKIIPGRICCFPIFDENLGTNKIGIAVESDEKETDQIKIEIIESLKNTHDIASEIFVLKPMSLIKTSSGKICRSKSKEKILKGKKILSLINLFLLNKNKPSANWDTDFYYSGLLDSLDIMDMILYLESNNIIFEKEKLTKNSFKIDLSLISDLENILNNTK